MRGKPVQILLTVLVAAILWLILASLSGPLGLNKLLIDWLSNQAWVKAPPPNLRTALVGSAWQLVVALVVSWTWVYPRAKDPGAWIADRYLSSVPPFLISPARYARGRTAVSEFRSRAVRFVGREDQLARLDAFLGTTPAFAWWWLHGPSGSGKSRLALEWLLLKQSTYLPIRARGWDAGFCAVYMIDKAFWLAWQPRRKTLIVIDDAAEVSDPVYDILEILSDRASTLRHPVRVLLVERSEPESLRKLGEETRIADHRHDPQPLTASLLDAEQLGRVVAAAATLTRGLRLTPEQRAEVEWRSGGSPLLALLAVNLIRHTGRMDWTSSRDLLTQYAQRIETKFVRGGLDRRCLPLVALATLTRGLAWEIARQYQPLSECGDKPSMDRLFGRQTSDAIPRIEPDLLGEAFLLRQFDRLNAPDRQRFLEVGWAADPQRVGLTLFYLAMDFGDSPTYREMDRPPTNRQALPFWGQVRVSLMAETDRNKWTVEQLLTQLEETFRPYRDDEDIQHTLAQGAVNAAGAYLRAQRWESLAKAFSVLRDIAARFPRSEQIQLALTQGAVSAILAHARAQRWEDLAKVIALLQAVAARFRNNAEIQNTIALGAVDLLDGIATAERWEEFAKAATLLQDVALFQDVAGRVAHNEEIDLAIARGAHNAAKAYGEDQRWEDLAKAFSLLQDVAARLPNNEQIQLELAKGAVNATVACGRAQRWADLAKAVALLQDITARFPDNQEIQLALAQGAYDAACHYGEGQRWEDLAKALSLLQDVAARLPNNEEIHLELAKGAVNAVGDFARGQRWEDSAKAFGLLLDVVIRFPNEQIQHLLAQGAVNAILAYGQGQRWEDLAKALSLLQYVAIRFPNDQEVQLALAKGALNAVLTYGSGQRVVDSEKAFAVLQDVAAGFPNDEQIQLTMARVALGLLAYSADAANWESALSSWKDLRMAAERFPHNKDIQELYERGQSLRAKLPPEFDDD